MLAILATHSLSLIDPTSIKRASSPSPSCLSLIDRPCSTAWSPDNTFLFLASSQSIHKYNSSSNSLESFYSVTETDPIFTLAIRDNGTLIFSAGDKIYALECGSIPKISQTFESHKSPVTSLSISNDASLLASTSSNAVHIHNLSLGSHTVLQGLALASQSITTCAFHPHLRTRLLLGAGKQLIVYDTTRPSNPMKTIVLNEASTGNIVAVACSPYSKTLVAVATTGGTVGLVDLDKKKGLFRTLNVRVPLTSIGFSPEGAMIYVGTENGKLIAVDLRSLDKPPKTIVISKTGDRIEAMSVQRKLKGTSEPSTKSITTAEIARCTIKSSNHPDSNPLRPPPGQVVSSKPGTKVAASSARRVARVGSGVSPVRRTPSTLKRATAKLSPIKGNSATEIKQVFSPVRDLLGNSGSAGHISVQLETLSTMGETNIVPPVKEGGKPSIPARGPRPPASPKVDTDPPSIPTPKTTPRSRATRATAPKEVATRRPRTSPATSNTRKTSTSGSASNASSARLAVPGDSPSHVPDYNRRMRSRAASSVSRGESESTPTIESCQQGSSISDTRSLSALLVPAPSVSRTPSPDYIHTDPITPAPTSGRGLGVLGLGTPEVEQWIKAGNAVEMEQGGRGKGKTVSFKSENEVENKGGLRYEDYEDEAREPRGERECDLTVQISPRRPTVSAPSSWVPSPLRHSIPASPGGGGSAHDLLRTIVKDVMYEFQRETRAEITGLHLDLVRMGRGWKKELRDLMDEYLGDLKDLRDENRRLREENERLKRGY